MCIRDRCVCVKWEGGRKERERELYDHPAHIRNIMYMYMSLQSCSKAWEYYGFVSEKDQAYKDAAFYYDKAWKYSNFSSPALGEYYIQ